MNKILTALANAELERRAAVRAVRESTDLGVTEEEDRTADFDCSSDDDAGLARETNIVSSTDTATTSVLDGGTVDGALWNWHRTRREEYGIATIDDEHGCNKACTSTESIQCVSEAHRLWGCMNSGRHHICHADERCEQRYTTQEGYTWCTFSRAMLSRTSDDTRYGVLLQASDEFVPRLGAGRERKRQQRRVKRLLELGKAYAAPDPVATPSLHQQQAADKNHRTGDVASTNGGGGDDSGGVGDGLHAPWSVGMPAETPVGTPPPPHSSQPPQKRMRFDMEVLGGPTRDMKAVREVEGGADTVALTGDCGNTAASDDDGGFVDVDGVDEVDRIPAAPMGPSGGGTRARIADAGAQTRPHPVLAIREAEESKSNDCTTVATTTNSDDDGELAITVPEPSRAVSRLRTRSSGRLAPAPPVLRDHFTRDTQLDIGRIIDALFNMRYRKGVVLHMRTTSETLVLDVLRKYCRQCKAAGVRPHSHVVDAVYTAAMDRNPRLTLAPDAELDRLRRKRYVAYIYELWRVAISTPYFERAHNKFRLINHVAGALYMLQEPFAIVLTDGITLETVIGRDDFLAKHLPAQNLLREWDAPMRVTSSSRVLAIKGVANGRARFSKTCVSSGRNAIKDALLSLETDRQRRVAAERIRNAYAHGTYHNDNIVYLVRD